MFCTKCGTDNGNEAKFCKSCGNPLNQKNSIDAIPSTYYAQPSTPAPAQKATISINKGVLVKLCIGLGILIVAIIGINLVLSNMGKTINLNKYLSFDAEGYDGYGNVYVEIDWDEIYDKYEDKITFTEKARKDFGSSYVKNMDAIEILPQYISISLEDNYYVANGDEISYTFTVNEDYKDYLDCKIQFKDGTYTVKDLTELDKFDPFEDLDVTFSGIAPYGHLTMLYDGDELYSSSFSADKYDGLKNGDKIKITISSDTIDYCAENSGKIPSVTEKEYTVTGLSSYVTKITEIDTDTLTAIKNQAKDVYNAYIARDWDTDTTSLESFTYIGSYLLTNKNPEEYYGNQNILYLVYKANARNTFTNDEGESYDGVTEIYWYIAYRDLLVANGSIIDFDVTRYEIPYNQFWVDSGINSNYWYNMEWAYKGYESLDSLYRDNITTQIDTYNQEDNIDPTIAATVVTEDISLDENGYILPNSEYELLTKADLQGLTADECKKARNEIYARHGRKFTDETLQAYFNSKDWYHGTIEPGDFKEDNLTEIEKANRDLIVEYEKENNYNQ